MLISQTVTTPATKSCPELWNRAVDRYHDACKERDGLKHHRKLMEAGEAFTQVVLAAGHYPEEKSFALNNLGLIMQAINRLPEAGNAFGFALTLNPDNATIMHNFATIRMCMDDFKGANEWFHKALEKDPKCPESRYNASYLALLAGDLKAGFEGYESRWECAKFTWVEFKSHKPKWNGEDLTGKTILLTHEQGYGDSIMLIRYAKLVKARGAAKVRFLCVPELAKLLATVEGVDEVTIFKDGNGQLPDHDFDYHCPMMSLPRVFGTTLETVPAEVPYVKIANAECYSLGAGDKLRVGLVWAGRPEHANDKHRSMKLAQFAPLFDVPGVQWVSLQFGPKAQEVDEFNAGNQLPYMIGKPKLNDFVDTARILQGLDLLISVDTAVVHLAGAMGRPVWTLLPMSPDWRWMLERTDSPWYPTMRLWRQKTKGDWDSVIGRLKWELLARVEDNATIR